MIFRTRFAPSPTGPLHLGHAYSALLAHDMARDFGGEFLLRMEDMDLQRSKPEWDALIIEDLTWLGVGWDGPINRQSDHVESYHTRLMALADHKLLYPCSCSRADIRAALSAPQEGSVFQAYPGTCCHRPMSDHQPGDALRLNMRAALAHLQGRRLAFEETGQAHNGHHILDPDAVLSNIGDVVLSRKEDGIVAYFLASALDDADQEITHVVRGEDLFEFTFVQVVLQALFNLPTPIYHHHKLIRDDAGKRLAKRDDARAIATYRQNGVTPYMLRNMVGL